MIKANEINEIQIDQFSSKLSALSITDLNLKKYREAYLIKLIFHRKYFLKIYAKVLNEVLGKSDKNKEDIFLIDYGAGNGLLGLFAKYCGFGKIIQVDISPGFIASQQNLSRELNVPIEENILGDFETLERFKHDPPDAIVGTDVIEHIYDLDHFFSIVQKLNKNMILVFTTASNDLNWWKKKKLMRIQYKDEWKGNDPQNGSGFLLSFREVRKNIIKKQLPEINDRDLEKLITNTRGLRKNDIEKACGVYNDVKLLPELISHPTNTCDPLSGSWTERFLSYGEYKSLFNRHGYTLFIQNGFYNQFQNGFKGIILNFANRIIRISGKPGGIISPFIILTGNGVSLAGV